MFSFHESNSTREDSRPMFKMMRLYSFWTLVGLIYLTSALAACKEESPPDDIASFIKTLVPADDLSLTANDILVLIPSNFNLTDSLDSDMDFNLFKLNTDNLLDHRVHVRKSRSVPADFGAIKQAGPGDQSDRAGRKINLFRNLFNKPKFSPLYLVNGTVCRFVNSAPICTTISTNGLPGLNQFNGNANQQFSQMPQQYSNNNQQGQGFNNNNNNNNQQQQGFNNNNNNNNQQQQGFNNNNNQQLRPAGLMDDKTPDINVAKFAKNSLSLRTNFV